MVSIWSPSKIRPFWSLGRVTELYTGNDGKTRSVRVRKADKSEGVYSICHLYPLELSLNSIESVNSHVNSEVKNSEVETAPQVRPRSTRAAAEACREKLKLCN